MTVGIAVVVPGGVLTVADGRTSAVFGDRVVNDQTEKIKTALPGMTTIVFGVTSVTEEALRLLRTADAPQTAQAAILLAKACLATAWQKFSDELDTSVDRSAPGLRAALIIAGVESGKPYFGATLVGFKCSLIAVGPSFGLYSNIVIGAEEHGSSENFISQLNAAKAHVGEKDHPVATGNRIAQAAADTIRAMSAVDRTVGGQIHYRFQAATGEIIAAVV